MERRNNNSALSRAEIRELSDVLHIYKGISGGRVERHLDKHHRGCLVDPGVRFERLEQVEGVFSGSWQVYHMT